MVVTYINLFEVPAGKEDAFVGFYHRVNDYLRDKPGYVGNTMHRARDAAARYAFINVVQWDSEEGHRAALDDGYVALVRSPEAMQIGLTFMPAYYDAIHRAGNHRR